MVDEQGNSSYWRLVEFFFFFQEDMPITYYQFDRIAMLHMNREGTQIIFFHLQGVRPGPEIPTLGFSPSKKKKKKNADLTAFSTFLENQDPFLRGFLFFFFVLF